MRGKLSSFSIPVSTFRITPADAGKTPTFVPAVVEVIGSPPRMRGKPDSDHRPWKGTGITPADAGKTDRHLIGVNQSQDHPRGCGENFAGFRL